jgi:hypothetical protein
MYHLLIPDLFFNRNFGSIHIFLKSFAATSAEYLPILSRGSQIVVTGKIDDIDSRTVRLDQCDLKPPSEPTALPIQQLSPQAEQATGTSAVPELEKQLDYLKGTQPSVQPPALLRRRPHLSCVEFSSFGMYQLIPNLIGAAFRIINDEKRFLSTAHDLQASIKLAHALGEELIVRKGTWYEHSSKRIEILGNTVSLGMQEQCWLMLFVTNNAVLDCRVVDDWPPDMTGAPQLEYGEWLVQVAITGGNVNHEFSGTLTIQKEGGFLWAPQV